MFFTGLIVALSSHSVWAVTTPPTLTSPAANTSYNSTVALSYSLPQAPFPGSVRITFTGESSTIIVMQTSDTDVSLDLDTSNLLSSILILSATPNTIPDGIYDVSFSYQNSFADPAATVSVENVYVGLTPPPAITSPIAATSFAPVDGIPLVYSLPVEPLSGSVQARLSNDEHSYTVDLPDTVGDDLAETLDISSAADGTYTLTLAYQDALGNPEATDSIEGIIVSTPVVSTPSSSSSGCQLQQQSSSEIAPFYLMGLMLLNTMGLGFLRFRREK